MADCYSGNMSVVLRKRVIGSEGSRATESRRIFDRFRAPDETHRGRAQGLVVHWEQPLMEPSGGGLKLKTANGPSLNRCTSQKTWRFLV